MSNFRFLHREFATLYGLKGFDPFSRWAKPEQGRGAVNRSTDIHRHRLAPDAGGPRLDAGAR